MNRTVIAGGLIIGVAAAVVLAAVVLSEQAADPVAPQPVLAREQARALSRPASQQQSDPIYTAADALARTLAQWPGWLERDTEVVRLLTYDNFANWAFAYWEPDSMPVWVVAISTTGAVQSDFGFDPSDDPVDGFWYMWKACSGEQLAFGGLSGAQNDALQALPDQDLSIQPCNVRPTGVIATAAPP